MSGRRWDTDACEQVRLEFFVTFPAVNECRTCFVLQIFGVSATNLVYILRTQNKRRVSQPTESCRGVRSVCQTVAVARHGRLHSLAT